MKKKFALLLLSLLCLCACALGITACNSGGNNDSNHEHSWSEIYTEDGDRHYQTCSGCDEKNYSDHTYIDGVCICGKNEPVIGTDGLVYKLNSDNKSYSVTGKGSATDTEIVIPSKYNGKPVTSIGNLAFGNSTLITSITIPDCVTSIEIGAFRYCPSLTSINIPDGITSISLGAFYGCSSLESITIPNKVTYIGDSAFRYCSSLTNVNIPNSVTSISSYAFCECSSLTSVTIPNSVTSIGESAFSSNSLTMYCEATSKPNGWNNRWSDCPTVWNCNNNDKDDNGDTYSVIDGIRYSLKDSKAYVVGQPTNIVTANIPETITHKNATYDVTFIKERAFEDCSSITIVTIPDSVTSIGYRAFSGCSSLASITVDENNPNYKSVNNCILSKDGTELEIGCKNSIIPDSVTSISDYAFYNCNSLTSIIIPNSVTSIGSMAFYNCNSLTSIIIPNSVTSIGYYTFSYCSSLTSITIPDSVTSLYINALFYCSSLTSISIGENNPNYKSVNNCILSKDGTELEIGCKNSIIPDSVTSIGSHAFEDSSLTSITIPNSVTSIGSMAFYNCSSLTSINFEGTTDEWIAISKGNSWNSNTGNYTVYCTDGQIAKYGTVTKN